MAYVTSEEYKNVIYSGGAKHRLLLYFNDVLLENAGRYVEKITRKTKILPNGNERFSLDNFISQEIELVINQISKDVIQSPVKISIGTLVGDEYEDIPLGVFEIQDDLKTDGNKITIKLRDYSVKLDSGYNGKPLIDEKGGSATRLEVAQDICTKAGLEFATTSFINQDKLIGNYDSTVNGRIYLSYLAELAGCVVQITRDGKVKFIQINNNLTKHIIPTRIVEKFTDGEDYRISRVVYEDGSRKFESGDDTYDTLFINAENPFVVDQDDITQIYNSINGFVISSFETGKVIGNPSIDPYDLISITHNSNNYVTLAQETLLFTGVMTTSFETTIGLEARKENVTVSGEAVFKKYVQTTIDNLEGEYQVLVGTTETIVGDIDDVNKELNNVYQDLNTKLDGKANVENVLEISREVEQLQTDRDVTFSFIEETKLNGVSQVKTETNIILNDDGLSVEKENAPTSANLDSDGLTVIDKTGNTPKEGFFSGYDNTTNTFETRTQNLSVKEYLNIGENSRFEDWLSDGGENFVAMFWMGD